LARDANLNLNWSANLSLIRHIEAGGIRTLMYGGNANFQHIGLTEFIQALEMLRESASPQTMLIVSIGPDFGKMMEQAEILRGRPVDAVMMLPSRSGFTPAGIEEGIKRATDRLEMGVVLYVRSDDYISPSAVERLVEQRRVTFIKYAIARDPAESDPYLTELVRRVGGQSIVSGMGERRAVVHLHKFGIATFTSGSACLAPRTAQLLLQAIRKGNLVEAEALRSQFIPLEDERDRVDPIVVLHDAVTLSGLENMGPLLPLMSNLESDRRGAVRLAAQTLRCADLCMTR
jgi:dihydrodipicolinate synthase/N-acetylneuraminate lyase